MYRVVADYMWCKRAGMWKVMEMQSGSNDGTELTRREVVQLFNDTT